MKINVASFGYFGYFLAREMSALGELGVLYTNLHAGRLRDIPENKRKINLPSALPIVLSKIGMHNFATKYLNWPCVEYFDQWVASNLDFCNIFHSFSSFGRRAHKVAREKYGAMTVVERGSSHIVYQNQILSEEYERWGLKFPQIDKRIIEKEQLEYEECDYITIQSSFAEKTFIEHGVPSKKLIKLPLGVDLSMFHPVSKNDSVFRVLYAGSFSLRKGTLYLLEAIKQLKLKNFEFVFNGHVSSELQKFLDPYTDIIKFVGMRPFDQLYKLYSQASVFVLPTLEDGFAKVITEAMACGVPVIATTNCGAEDVMTDGQEGFIIPIRDVRAIRDRILFMYENPDIRDQMAAASLAKAKELLSCETHGLRALDAYSNAYRKFQT